MILINEYEIEKLEAYLEGAWWMLDEIMKASAPEGPPREKVKAEIPKKPGPPKRKKGTLLLNCSKCEHLKSSGAFTKEEGAKSKEERFCRSCTKGEAKVIGPGEKRCSKCKKTKPLNKFTANEQKPDGYGSRCKECNAEKARRYYRKKHPEIKRRYKPRKPPAKEEGIDERKCSECGGWISGLGKTGMCGSCIQKELHRKRRGEKPRKPKPWDEKSPEERKKALAPGGVVKQFRCEACDEVKDDTDGNKVIVTLSDGLKVKWCKDCHEAEFK